MTVKSSYSWFLLFLFTILMFHPLWVYPKEFYKWIDENGVVHVTDNIEHVPEKYRPGADIEKNNNKIGIKEAIEKYIRYPTEHIREFAIFTGFVIFLITLYFTTLKFKKIILNKLVLIKSDKSEKLVLSSGISELNPEKLKKAVNEILKEDGYKISAESGSFSFTDFIVTRGGEKMAVIINDSLNPVSRRLLNDVNIEANRLGCTGSIIFTRNTFESDAQEYAKEINCILVNKYLLARMIIRYSALLD